jgi:hypothetical protein
VIHVAIIVALFIQAMVLGSATRADEPREGIPALLTLAVLVLALAVPL